MNKRGISHVEVILASIIFIVAMGFALYIFSPGGNNRLVETYLAYSFTEILKNTTEEINVYSVKLFPRKILENEIAIRIPEANGKTRVKTYEGVVLNSYGSGELVNIEKTLNSWPDFINIQFSEGEDATLAFSGKENGTYYEISTSYHKEVISEKKIKELVKRYAEDYEGLRESLNLKSGLGFSLVFQNGNDEIMAEREIPAGIEVYSDKKRVEVVRENGDTVYADLNVKVW